MLFALFVYKGFAPIRQGAGGVCVLANLEWFLAQMSHNFKSWETFGHYRDGYNYILSFSAGCITVVSRRLFLFRKGQQNKSWWYRDGYFYFEKDSRINLGGIETAIIILEKIAE